MDRNEYFSHYSDDERWEILQGYYQTSFRGKVSLIELAKNCGSSWFDSRASDTPESFICYSWYQMNSMRGFGKKKLQMLVDILVSNADLQELIDGDYKRTEPADVVLEIEGWDSFPLELCFCSARTRAVFEAASLQTPHDLVEWYSKAGEHGVLAYGNAGRKTLKEILQVYNSWKQCDLKQLQKQLPIDDDLQFTLRDTIIGHYYHASEENQKILRLRLVDGNTLEQCGSVLRKTRERIRQIEKALLSVVEKALDYFAEERGRFFSEWQQTGDISDIVGLSEADQRFFKAALLNSFERSDEGKDTIAQNEQLVDSLLQDIRENWDYYCEGLELDPYLSRKGAGALKERILEVAETKEAFAYHANNDRLTHTKVLLKHAALACLKSYGRSEWSGTEWLEKLKESKRFEDVDLSHLKHLYSNWREDPKFGEFSINFSACNSVEAIEALEPDLKQHEPVHTEIEIITVEDSDEDVEESQTDRLDLIRAAVEHPAEGTPVSVPVAETRIEDDSRSRDLDLLLRSAIEEAQSLSSEDTLLGFLNISDEDQDEILSVVREDLHSQDAFSYIRKYPALASYALTLAAAVGLQKSNIGSGSFYLAWDFSIGWSPAPAMRARIASAYLSALKHLDLRIGTIFKDQTRDWKGGCYLFHAAVLPHFIGPLEVALRAVQRELPLPDPDEPQQISNFAQLLANRVEPGQRRLIAVLESPVGALLVRRLVLWHMTGDPELFPPFILKTLEEQKSEGQETIIKRPYILFDHIEEELLLELPAQSNKITSHNSRWTVNGRAFRADAIREPIRLVEITSNEESNITVEIEGLLRKTKNGTSELRKQNYTFETHLTKEQPFKIFRESDGREVRFQTLRGQVELALGNRYFALLGDDLEIESAHEGEPCDLGQVVEFELNIDSPALVFNDGENEWAIKPRIKPGAFLHRRDAMSFKAQDLKNDEEVYINFGSDFGLTLALPSGSFRATVFFESKTVDAGRFSSEISTTDNGEHITLVELSAEYTDWLSTLPPAIHQIEITVVPVGRKSFLKKVWYWKGLSYVTQSGDMYCEELPRNLTSNGYSMRENHFEYTPVGARCAEFASNLEDPELSFRLQIPKPGVDVTISSSEGEPIEVNPSHAIDILPNDTRIITFQHGGLAPVELRSGETQIGLVDTDRRSITKSLGALVASLGKTGSIVGYSQIPHFDEVPERIVRWRTPKVVNHCNAVDNGDGEYHWKLTGLSSVGLKAIRVRIFDLEDLTREESVIELDLPEHVEHQTKTTIIEGLSVEVSMNFNDCYRFIFDHERHQFSGKVHVVEMDCMIADGSGWQRLACNEGHGRLSDLRLLFKGHKPDVTQDENLVHHVFWNDLNTIGFGHSLTLQLGDPEIVAGWLETARWLVNYRYPKTVWEKYSIRLKALYHAVTEIAVDNDCAGYWWQNATAGLEEHAKRKALTATIAPCLLFGAAFAGPFPPLGTATRVQLRGDDLITRSFSEASQLIEAGNGALSYVQSAFKGGNIDQNFLGHFSSLSKLFQMQDVPLEGFSLSEWNSKLSSHLRHASFEDVKDEFKLLEPDHYLECVRKLSARGSVLDSIRCQESSHWLSPHISKLNQIAERAGNVLRKLTGNSYEELWEPFESSELLLLEEDLRSLVVNFIKVSSVLAAVYTSVNKGRISSKQAMDLLDKEFGNESNIAETRRFLILGTAPELVAYFFLLFTFTL